MPLLPGLIRDEKSQKVASHGHRRQGKRTSTARAYCTFMRECSRQEEKQEPFSQRSMRRLDPMDFQCPPPPELDLYPPARWSSERQAMALKRLIYEVAYAPLIRLAWPDENAHGRFPCSSHSPPWAVFVPSSDPRRSTVLPQQPGRHRFSSGTPRDMVDRRYNLIRDVERSAGSI